ncbi:MAG: FecR domain-containing protein [Bacteroidota bacterium]
MNRPLPPDLHALLDNEDDRDALAALWAPLEVLDRPVAVDTDAAWRRVRARTTDAKTPRRAPARPPVRRRLRRGILAGTLTAAAAVAALVLLRPVTWEAGPGETLTERFADGTEVTLNSGSRLRFRPVRGDGRPRVARLEGEAFFDVAAGAPFAVETADARVEVLGTAFNVRSYGDRTRVVLAHGAVRVASETDAVTLAAGEAAATTEAGLVREAADVARQTVWQRGGLAFDAEPLSAVVAEVARRYAVAFSLAPGVPRTAPTTAFYPTLPELPDLLGDLGAGWEVRFIPVRGGYRVEPARAATSSL